MGYNRSAKKCKEKFENVHKYYKRTKESRAGRQDGKSYRYFNQLEALHSGGGTGSSLCVSSAAMIPATTFQPPLPVTPISVGNPMMAPGRIQTSVPPIAGPSAQFPSIVLPAGISFSTSSEEEGEEDESEEEGTETGGRKRKRPGGGGSSVGGRKKMMSFFEALIKQVMERQEAMQQRFLETIEKREKDRMIREEAWKRQEMARLTREHELMAQERAMAASRDAAVIGFLQKITGQTIPTTAATTITTLPPPTTPSSTVTQPLLHPIQTISFQQPSHDIIAGAANVRLHPPQPSTSAADAAADREQRALETAAAMSGSFDPASSSSRWPKAEVHALIKLRSGLEGRYQEAGPKGPLWEEISSEMRRIGYNRSSKRCKEKWENINKYFKKVKESNKKRPEDAKTCPYFHQLDALYKKKLIAGAGSSAGQTRQDHHQGSVSSTISQPLPDQSGAKDKNNNMSNNSSNKASGGHDGGSNAGSNVQIQTSNGDHPPSFFQEDQAAIKKPEDIMKELMEQQQSVMDDYDSDNLELEEEDGELDNDEEEEEKNKEKMAYKIQFQQQGPAGSSSNGGSGNVGASPTATSAGSFLAVVQ